MSPDRSSLDKYDDLSPLEFAYLLAPAMVEASLYGVYAALFWGCLYIFRKRKLRGRKVILLGTVLLFCLCTVQCIFSALTVPLGTFFVGMGNLLYTGTNFIADSLLTYRCYVIWGRKKAVIWAPVLLILTETAVGAISSLSGLRPLGGSPFIPGLDPRATLFITLATNVMLTLLSAGRIWWISRKLKILGPKVSKKYNTVIALIIESGAIYCVSISAYLISIPKQSVIGPLPGDIFFTTDVISRTCFGILTQIVGIVPTLIVIRMALGVSTEDAQTMIIASGLRFNHGGNVADEAGPNWPTTIHSNAERHTV